VKLLSRVEARSAQETEVRRHAARLVEVAEALKEQQIALNAAEEAFNKRLEEQRASWEAEEEGHRQDIARLKEEVRMLEERRRDALIPVEIERSKADALVKEAAEHLAAARTAMSDAQKLQELLEDRLDEVGQREQDVQGREETVAERERGAAAQAAMTAAGAQKLAEDEHAFRSLARSQSADLAELERRLTARIAVLEDREAKVAADAEANRIERRRLQDLAATLKRAQER